MHEGNYSRRFLYTGHMPTPYMKDFGWVKYNEKICHW